MKFTVIISKFAFKELSKINKQDQQLIFDKIKELENGNF